MRNEKGVAVLAVMLIVGLSVLIGYVVGTKAPGYLDSKTQQTEVIK